MHSIIALAALATLTAAVPHAGHKHMHQHLHARFPTPGQSNNGACGGDLGFTCATGYCCSEWGYCGKSAAYCGNGCQEKYGTCRDSSSSGNSTSAVSVVAVSSTTTVRNAVHSGPPHWSGQPGYQPSSAQSSPAQSPSAYSSEEPTSTPAPAPMSTSTTTSVASPTTFATSTSTWAPAPTTTSAPAYTPPASSSSSAAAPTSSASSGSSGSGSGTDSYKMYLGDGTTGAGWPSQDSWVDFESMWSNNMDLISVSCAQFGQPNNSPDESASVKSNIQSVASGASLDPRFVLAIVMQESKGCVRAPTTNYGVSNPGLMQSHDGTGTCNSGSTVSNPCPDGQIHQMISDGSTETAAGPGLSALMTTCGASDVSKYYKTARMYNSGSIASSGNLQDGIATHCYASDIANRLTGWVKATTACNLD